LAKNYKYGSTVLISMDVVNVMAACEPMCLCAMCIDHGAGRYLFLEVFKSKLVQPSLMEVSCTQYGGHWPVQTGTLTVK
jgi:hypothetical protein